MRVTSINYPPNMVQRVRNGLRALAMPATQAVRRAYLRFCINAASNDLDFFLAMEDAIPAAIKNVEAHIGTLRTELATLEPRSKITQQAQP